MREVLVKREARLQSYHVAVTTVEGEHEAQHEFWFRSPNHTKGSLLAPNQLTLSFDGRTFYKLTPEDKKLEVFDIKLPVEKASYFLMSQFAPFVPEGYRTPLLPSQGVTAKKTSHPKAPDAVELTLVTSGGEKGDVPVTVAWVLRAGSGDFLSKTMTTPTGKKETRVDEEKCDEVAKLCVPTAITELENGAVAATLKMTTVELNAPIPNDSFVLSAPEGTAVEKHVIKEAEATDQAAPAAH